LKKRQAMMELESMAVEMPEVAGHPNRTAFRGVLTTVDVPSQRAPSGARGHLVVLTKQAAEKGLPSLLGMALDYAPTLDRHDVRRKVGVITRAEVVGNNLEVGGYLFARDFPEIVKEIAKTGNAGQRRADTPGLSAVHAAAIHRLRRSWREADEFQSSLRAIAQQIGKLTSTLLQSNGNLSHGLCRTIRAETSIASAGEAGLGLSYEVTDVRLSDARTKIWVLEGVTFTGAAILRRDKAAYRETWIELCGR
jgi:hypothetical protein